MENFRGIPNYQKKSRYVATRNEQFLIKALGIPPKHMRDEIECGRFALSPDKGGVTKLFRIYRCKSSSTE